MIIQTSRLYNFFVLEIYPAQKFQQPFVPMIGSNEYALNFCRHNVGLKVKTRTSSLIVEVYVKFCASVYCWFISYPGPFGLFDSGV